MRELVCAMVLWAACATAQTVDGSVLNAATGVGIAGVKVDILAAGKKVYSTTTDSRGHFLIEGVKNGTYTVTYSAQDYWPSDPGTPGPFQANMGLGTQAFQVTDGGNPVKLEGHMVPLPRITGRVEDGAGKGVPGARAELAGAGPGLNSSTDGEGRFVIHQFLLPGVYTLSVAPPLGLKPPDPEPEGGRVLGWTRTWYPGVAFPEAAAKILLRPGGEVWDFKLKLLAVPAHFIRGVVLNSDGKPAPKVEITVGETLHGPQMLQTESKADGTFEFPAVVDGEWILQADAESGDLDVRAAQWIEMTGREMENLKLQLREPFTVRGKVVFEKPENGPSPKLPMIFLSPHAPRSRNAFVSLGPNATPGLDGSFSIEHVYPGLYGIYEDGDPPVPYYLDSIRMGEAEVTTEEVEVSSGAPPITLVYKTNGGTLSGAVENCASGRVVLIPQDKALQRSGFLRAAICDYTDRYTLPAVRPGEYYALAIPKDITVNYRKLDETLLKQAASVTVNAGEASSADLHLMTRPPF